MSYGIQVFAFGNVSEEFVLRKHSPMIPKKLIWNEKNILKTARLNEIFFILLPNSLSLPKRATVPCPKITLRRCENQSKPNQKKTFSFASALAFHYLCFTKIGCGSAVFRSKASFWLGTALAFHYLCTVMSKNRRICTRYRPMPKVHVRCSSPTRISND